MPAAKAYPTADTLNRVAKILMDSGEATSYEDAQARLAKYAVRVVITTEAARTAEGQAALSTIVCTGKRALPGGVFVEGVLDALPVMGPYAGKSLGSILRVLGARIGETPSVVLPTIFIGELDVNLPTNGLPALQCIYDGWRGGIRFVDSPTAPSLIGRAIPPAAALAGAIAVAEIFQFHRGGNAEVGERVAGLSLWQPERTSDWWVADSGEPTLTFLPKSLWLVGLGHLGQAYLWLLGLLPYPNPAEVELVLQDFDRLATSNISTSVLTDSEMVGDYKTRAMADWCDARGFRTRILESRFSDNFTILPDDPAVCLCGVDNAIARAALGDAGFKLVVNVGLGAGPVEFMAMRLYAFPGPKSPREIWGGARPATQMALLYRPAYSKLREDGLDECGLTLLAERTVGAPFVGVTAACLVIAEVLRALHGGKRTAVFDTTLASLNHRQVFMEDFQSIGNPGFVEITA